MPSRITIVSGVNGAFVVGLAAGRGGPFGVVRLDARGRRGSPGVLLFWLRPFVRLPEGRAPGMGGRKAGVFPLDGCAEGVEVDVVIMMRLLGGDGVGAMVPAD